MRIIRALIEPIRAVIKPTRALIEPIKALIVPAFLAECRSLGDHDGPGNLWNNS